MKSILLMFLILVAGCGNNNSTAEQVLVKDTQKRVYGKSLNIDIEIKNFDDATLYIPKNLKVDEKLPVVLFAPGWSSVNHSDYATLLTFIAGQGYAAIYAPSPMAYGADITVRRFSRVLNDDLVSKYFDKSRLGVVGHSSGGGIALKIMDYFSDHGYGSNGRFIFSMDPWFAFGMSEDDFKNFPKNTYLVIQQFGNSGGTDPRIALTIFDKLSHLGDENRDYQYYDYLNHGYPFGNSYESVQIILKPLDALMDYAFFKKQEAYQLALNLGSDTPYENLQPVNNTQNYSYRCDADGDTNKISAFNGVDYCQIVPKVLQNN